MIGILSTDFGNGFINNKYKKPSNNNYLYGKNIFGNINNDDDNIFKNNRNNGLFLHCKKSEICLITSFSSYSRYDENVKEEVLTKTY